MNSKNLYTKYSLHCIRIIAGILAIIFLLIEVFTFNKISYFFTINAPIDIKSTFSHIINIVSFFLFLFVILIPTHFEIFSIISFLYAVLIIPFDLKNIFGILLYFLGTSVLVAKGCFNKNKKTKLSICFSIPFILLLCNFRFGFNKILINFIIFFIAISIISIYSFFLHVYYNNILLLSRKPKLNIAKYDTLNERDSRILQYILDDKKYSEIANIECITEGTLKNRIHVIYSILDIENKKDFISKYRNYEICYNINEK